MKHIKLTPVNLKNHPQLDERWVHDVICEDPAILGLGGVVVKDRERIQPGAGRLDLLLQDEDGHGRYEVEIQLGPSDPSHIIRTLEYWDREKRRYPQYDHTAVIVAEDITSRFLNVISLFNGTIPVMAIQMKAVTSNEGVSLFFTRVLDTIQLGYVDEDEEVNETTDRAYWENRASPKSVKIADQIRDLCEDFEGEIELNYNKHYIGLIKDGKACNFALCKPRKSASLLELRIPQSAEIDDQLEQHEFDVLEYDKRSGTYRVRLTPATIGKHGDYLKGLLRQALEIRTGN